MKRGGKTLGPACLMLLVALAVSLAARPSAADDRAVTPPDLSSHNRVLAIAPTPRGGPPLTPPKVLAAVSIAQKAGVHGIALFNNWSQLEPSPGHYDVSDPGGAVSYLGGKLGWQLVFTIGAINTVKREVPGDLQDTPWDSPEMIGRFHALIDQLVPIFDAHLAYISVGNEIDIYLSSQKDAAAQWNAYTTFYKDAVNYIHSVAPGIKVGFTSTFGGASGLAHDQVQALSAASDAFILTYYPLGPDFIPVGADAPLRDFPTMVQLAHGLPVVLQEVGYPSSRILQSSPREQAQFVSNVFNAWSAAGSSIPFLSYFCMHDFGAKWCGQLLDYYGIHDRNFEAYLCSLGIRGVGGAAKPGWSRFVKGAKQLNKSQ